MENLAYLRDLVRALEEGRKYHISVAFFDRSLVDRFLLPGVNRIHATPFCNEVKKRPNGLKRCMRCRQFAMDKAKRLGCGYGGYCINGLYEYCKPVYRDDSCICIIFVGNIVRDRELFLKKSGLRETDPLLDSVEYDMSDTSCKRVARVVESYILMLWDHLPVSSTESHKNATISAIKSYLDYYFHLDITLSEIAKMYHYNDKYLGMLFKKQLGMSFSEYLNKRRLDQAKSLLTETRQSILEIAAASGFNNVTYFNRLFKSKFGMTPSEFRRSHK